MAREIPTFYDAVFDVTQFAARRGVGVSAQDCRSAVIDAYAEICDRHAWAFNKKYKRINIEKPKTTGTVAYTASTRVLTLTGSTWPTDAADWVVVLDNVTYQIDSYTAPTTIVLDSDQAPTADIAAGETYELYRQYYTLPDDFIACVDPMPAQDSSILGRYMTMDEMLNALRSDTSSGSAVGWAIGPIPDVYGRKAIWTFPPNSDDDTLDLWYRSKPRELRYSGYEAKSNVGTVTVVASSKTVTGSSTTFEDLMEGSLFRIGSSTTQQPTGFRGVNPWVEQRSIITYSAATTLTLDAVVSTSRSGVKYTITDPLDLDPTAVPALYRLAERNLSQLLGGKEVDRDARRAEQAILTARGALNPDSERRRIAGAGPIRISTASTFEFDDGGVV